MRYIFHKQIGEVIHTDPTETMEFVGGKIQIRHMTFNEDLIIIKDSEFNDIKDLRDLKNRIEKQKEEILSELEELDKSVPRIAEDLIEFVGYKPDKSKEEVIGRKKILRQKLRDLQVV